MYRTRGNFIDQFERSYSNNAHTVAQLGADFIKAQQHVGVAATAKHFPGLGAATTTQDTDTEPVTLNVRLAALRSTDELPYTSAIAAGVRLVMVSWATYPAFDPHHPAGLSSAVVQGELRNRLKFTGVTITDALEADALNAFGTTSNRAVLAAGAGMDLLLCAGQNVGQGNHRSQCPRERPEQRQAQQDRLRGLRPTNHRPPREPRRLTRKQPSPMAARKHPVFDVTSRAT